MATYQCPKGHISTDPDYCSECGALIGQSTVSRAHCSHWSRIARRRGVPGLHDASHTGSALLRGLPL